MELPTIATEESIQEPKPPEQPTTPNQATTSEQAEEPSTFGKKTCDQDEETSEQAEEASDQKKKTPAKSSKNTLTEEQVAILPTHPPVPFNKLAEFQFNNYVKAKQLTKDADYSGLSKRQSIHRKIYEKIAVLYDIAFRARNGDDDEIQKCMEEVDNIRMLSTTDSMKLAGVLIRCAKQKIQREKKASEKKVAEETAVDDDGEMEIVTEEEEVKKKAPVKKTVAKKITPACMEMEKDLKVKNWKRLTMNLYRAVPTEEIQTAVQEIVLKEREDLDKHMPLSCFTCKNKTTETFSTGCCEFALELCKNCMEGFVYEYAKDGTGRTKKMGFFGCYSCLKSFGYLTELEKTQGAEGADFVNVLEGENEFFARFLHILCMKQKTSLFSSRREILMEIAGWLYKILKDKVSVFDLEAIENARDYGIASAYKLKELKKYLEKGLTAEKFFEDEKEKSIKKNANAASRKAAAKAIDKANEKVKEVTEATTQKKPAGKQKVEETKPVEEEPTSSKTEEESTKAEEESMEVETVKKQAEKPKESKRKYHTMSDDEDDEPAPKAAKVEEHTILPPPPAKKPTVDEDEPKPAVEEEAAAFSPISVSMDIHLDDMVCDDNL